MCHLRQKVWHDLNAAQVIGEYVEKAGITAGPLIRAQAAPRSRERLSNLPLDSATMYRVIQGYLRRLPGAMKKERLEDGSEVEYCVYTPHSLGATTVPLLLDAGVDFKKAQKLTRTPAHHDDSDLRQAADRCLAKRLA